jgi:hypothetical protein
MHLWHGMGAFSFKSQSAQADSINLLSRIHHVRTQKRRSQ